MNYNASITSQGQLTIPKALRKKYGITKRAQAVITDTEKGMLVKTYTDDDFWALRGILKDNPVVKKTKRMSLQQRIRAESKAFEKAITDNVVEEMGLPKRP